MRGQARSVTRPPALPLRPGRRAMSKRTRLVVLAVLLAALLAAGVLGAVLARSPAPPPRAVPIPAADRAASPALIRSAEGVGFRPLGQGSGVGEIESKPAAAAPAPLSRNLLPVGTAAPQFTLRTPVGTPVRLADLRGRPVLLEFFTTWCPHCAAEAPHLQRLFRSLGGRAAFLAVNANSEDAPSVLAYHVYFGLGFPAVLDPGPRTVTFPDHGPQGPVTRSYGVEAYPTFYVLDRAGRIVWRGDGEQPDAVLRRALSKASEKPGSPRGHRAGR
jgi:thiol-disulfide isomerase/thioredoxin